MATRERHIRKVHLKRTKKSIEKIDKIINGMFSFDYKMKSGKWNISLISRDSGLSRNTVYRYMESFK